VTLSALLLNNSSGTAGLTMSGGTTTINGNLRENNGTSATATFNISGGSLTVNGTIRNDIGSSEGNTVFTQTGGTINVPLTGSNEVDFS